jgi:ABC-type uncharacterized transport system permease subunit
MIGFLASVMSAMPPLLLAVLGETITEKAGVINLSLNGSIQLAAAVGYIVIVRTGDFLLGFAAAMAAGALIALIIPFASLSLHQPQVATGFVLAVLCANLADVLGAPYTGQPKSAVPPMPITGLADIPVIGPILFSQNLLVYLSLLAVIVAWAYMFKTRPGLLLQGLGERPAASFARGTHVIRMRYLYTLIGGALVGLGGAAFSLSTNLGWVRPSAIEGYGWIALAIVIFGNWHPIRAALGVFLFTALDMAASPLQSALPQVPTQLLKSLPFPLMIFTLLLVTISNAEWVNWLLSYLPAGLARFLRGVIRALQTSPPAALGSIPREE